MRLWIPHTKSENKQRFLVGLTALCLSWLLGLGLQRFGFNQQFDETDLDRLTRTAPLNEQYSDRITIVAINDDDYHSARFRAQSPLNSDQVLELIRDVQDYHPLVIGLDLLTGDWHRKLKSGDIRPNPPVVWARGGIERSDAEHDRSIPSIEGGGVAGYAIPPSDMCYGAPASRPDADGTIRRYFTAVNWKGANEETWFPRPSMARILASVSPEQKGRFDCKDPGSEGVRLIAFAGPFHRFRTIASSVVFQDVNRRLAGFFRGRIALIGGTFNAARDRWRSSGGYLDGVQILAHAVESEISGSTGELKAWQSAGLSLLVSFLFFLALFYVPQPWDTLGSIIGPIVAALLIGYYLYNSIHFFLGVAAWMISVPISTAVQHYTELAYGISVPEREPLASR